MATYYSSSSSSSISSSQGAGAASALEDSRSIETLTNRYTDLDLQMIVHPQKKDIIPLKGAAAIKNAIKNLLLTFLIIYKSSKTKRLLLIKDYSKFTVQKLEVKLVKINLIMH